MLDGFSRFGARLTLASATNLLGWQKDNLLGLTFDEGPEQLGTAESLKRSLEGGHG